MYFRHNKIRLGQDVLIKEIDYVLNNNLIGLFEAPTGLGKTDASLAVALEYAEKNNKKIFFVTPKNSQHKIVIDTIKEINKKFDKQFIALDLISKSNLCIDPFLYNLGPEFYELCEKKIKNQSCYPYLNANGHGPFKTNVVNDFINEYKIESAEEFRELCNSKQLCPYEMGLKVAKSANIIICDVNHIFINKIRNNIFNKINIGLEDVIFIFDEAHNLPSRLRNILSDNLSLKQIINAKKDWEKVPKEKIYDITEFLEDFEYCFNNLKNGFLDTNSFGTLFENSEILESLATACDYILELDKKKSNLNKIFNFILAWMHDSKVKTRYKTEDTIHIKGLDPSYLSDVIFEECFGCILMSGTFSPLNMYSELLGIKRPYFKQFKSPFPNENKLVMYFDNVTTKYEERKESIPKIIDIIINITNKVSGNIAVFFPSYDILQSVYLRISQKIIKKIYVQEKNQNVTQTKRLIANFKKNKVGFGSVLFAVVGGSFSEGVDYPGDDLIGIIMVGFPFPEPDYEMNALIEFYDKKTVQGWNYAYLYPTISKIVQACGRGIRSETDKAFILLLDKRFGWSKYNQLLPIDYNLRKFDNNKFSEFIGKM